MTVTLMVEPWTQFEADAKPCWEEHYSEFEPFHQGLMPMGVALEDYRGLESRGQLQTLVAREAGLVVGYCIVVVRAHLHYCTTLCGFEDSYFLTKRLRKGFTGYRLLKESLELLKVRGVKRAYFMTKEFNSVRVLLERLGLTKCDEVYSVWLED